MEKHPDFDLESYYEQRRILLQEYADICRWFYIDYMLGVYPDNISFERLKKFHHELLEEFLNKIHDKYIDHVEGIQKDLEKLYEEGDRGL